MEKVPSDPQGLIFWVYAALTQVLILGGNISILRQMEGLENEKANLLRVADTSFLTPGTFLALNKV